MSVFVDVLIAEVQRAKQRAVRARKQVYHYRTSRDMWEERAKECHRRARALDLRVRQLTWSRDFWKAKARRLEARERYEMNSTAAARSDSDGARRAAAGRSV